MNQFNTLIFDIGNVIIDIDYRLPIMEFQKLTDRNIAEIFTETKQSKLFDRFETGVITRQQFFDELKQFMRNTVTDAQLLAAWNSILVAYPKNKTDLLAELRKSYRVLALSNINEIHVEEIDKAAKAQLEANVFADFFDKAYYSNEIGFRKPNADIYGYIAEVESLVPEKTFFVDDRLENVEAARAAGWNAHQLTKPENLYALLRELKIV